MKEYTKYRICLWKSYFGHGLGITNFAKYFIIMFGAYESIALQNIKITMMLGVIWGIACFFIGWAWLKYGWYTADIEVGNNYNKFVNEMRKKIK